MLPGVVSASGGGPVVEAKPGLIGLQSDYDDFVNITPVACWSTVRRSTLYTGPAIRVEDASNPGTQVDVNFDGDGRLTGATPYGTDTRVITIYDQFGSEDLTAAYTAGITVGGDNLERSSWRIEATGGVGMYAPTNTGSSPAWELGSMVWAMSMERTIDFGALTAMWGVDSASNFMEIGIWIENSDNIHWRVNSSVQADWTGTNWTANSSIVQNVVGRFIADMTDGSDAHGYFNNVLGNTRSSVLPIVFSSGKSLGLFDWNGLGGPWTGDFEELVIFSNSGTMSSDNRGWLDEALDEFSIDPAWETLAEEELYVIDGVPEAGNQLNSQETLYVVEGIPNNNELLFDQDLYVIEP